VVPETYRTGIADTTFFGSPYGIIGYDALAMWNDNFWEAINSSTIRTPTTAIASTTSEYLGSQREAHHGVREGGHQFAARQPSAARQYRCAGIQADQSSLLHLTNTRIPAGTADLPITIVEEGAKYTDVLPSLNLALEFPHDMKLRFGAAITVARPRLDELGGGASYTVVADNGTPTVIDGVPTTGPAMAAAIRS
jgi:iron complex outermembrane receptor protein